MAFAEIDAHLVAPKRFATLGFLNQVERADFSTLQTATDLTAPDLSKIVRDLEDRKLVAVTKERRTRYGTTVVEMTPDGRATFKNLLATLNRIAGQ
ncbi:transcriptional regulator [Agrococcus casei]|uniref:transcriptional regulator n=1 Tax=Agrococcus casei TaxID=343512 RepID=UPI003F932536